MRTWKRRNMHVPMYFLHFSIFVRCLAIHWVTYSKEWFWQRLVPRYTYKQIGAKVLYSTHHTHTHVQYHLTFVEKIILGWSADLYSDTTGYRITFQFQKHVFPYWSSLWCWRTVVFCSRSKLYFSSLACCQRSEIRIKSRHIQAVQTHT